MENKQLKHHGIKGMRWGHRRYQNPDGSLTAAGRKRYGDGYAEGDQAKRLSEQELRNRTSRIRAENDYIRAQKEYSQLTAKQKSAGRKFAEEVLLSSGKQIASTYITKFATSKIDGLFDKNTTSKASEAMSRAKGMSDDELQKVLNRMRNEREYTKFFS